MRKIFILLVVFLLTACSSSSNKIQEENDLTKEESVIENIEEEEYEYITLRIPKYYSDSIFGDDADLDDDYFNKTVNEDGSINIDIPVDLYDEFLEPFCSGLDESIDDLIKENDHIENIDYMNDYTYYEVTVDDPNNLEDIIYIEYLLTFIGVSYDAFTSNSTDTYTVVYYDKNDNKLDTYTYLGTFDSFMEEFSDIFGE